MKQTQEIYDTAKSLMPDDWEWFTIFFMYGEDGRTRQFIEYGSDPDERERKNLQNLGSGQQMSDLSKLFFELRDKFTPEPLDKFTHIELICRKNGEAKSILGYGKPNWDIMLGGGWPDDITADSYTYKNAWPDGIPDKMKPLMKDPRTLAG